MSDMEGSKALFLENFCIKRKIPYIRFDYSGHGLSSGEFCDGNISKWLNDALDIIDKVSEGKQIIIGSSMGSWIMLLVALRRKDKIKALISIACATDFTENLIWEKLSEKDKNKLKNGEIVDLIGDCSVLEDKKYIPYPITMQLIKNGRENLLLHKESIDISCPVRFLHGMQDVDVPYEISINVAKLLKSDNIRINLLKNSDHRMSTEECLLVLVDQIEELLGR